MGSGTFTCSRFFSLCSSDFLPRLRYRPSSRALSSSANGALIVDGGTFVLAKADLKGLEKIVLKNGAVLSGRAYFNSDLVIEVGAGCENRLRQIGGMALIVR